MSQIDISGLDKGDVLAALYNASKAQGRGWLHFTPEDMTKEKVTELIAQDHYEFEYLGGRVMKVNIAGDSFDAWLYDRDNGQGAAERAITKLRPVTSDAHLSRYEDVAETNDATSAGS